MQYPRIGAGLRPPVEPLWLSLMDETTMTAVHYAKDEKSFESCLRVIHRAGQAGNFEREWLGRVKKNLFTRLFMWEQHRSPTNDG